MNDKLLFVVHFLGSKARSNKILSCVLPTDCGCLIEGVTLTRLQIIDRGRGSSVGHELNDSGARIGRPRITVSLSAVDRDGYGVSVLPLFNLRFANTVAPFILIGQT